MKLKILLPLGAAIATIVALNLNASTPFFTPRSAGNQIKTVPAVNTTPAVASVPAAPAVLQTPRAAGNQVVHVPAALTLSAPKCQIAGTPRSITAAGSSARMSCCGMTVAACTSSGACAKSN